MSPGNRRLPPPRAQHVRLPPLIHHYELARLRPRSRANTGT